MVQQGSDPQPLIIRKHDVSTGNETQQPQNMSHCDRLEKAAETEGFKMTLLPLGRGNSLEMGLGI